ncbi:MAG: hypothetical protein KDA61_15345 [Planctomycetales bacterium]|nr:hypothetical protein [Planctomycetales bacterium]
MHRSLALLVMPVAFLCAACGQTSQAQAQVQRTPAMEYFGGRRLNRLNMANQRPMHAPGTVATAPPVIPRSKPFSTRLPEQGVSPYLALDLPTSDSTLPNYYAFVQPRFEQQQRFDAQQAQFRQLQQQMHTGIDPNRPAPGSTVDYRNHFMNSGAFYQSVR